MTLTCEHDQDRITLNPRVKYLPNIRQKSFGSEVIVREHTDTHAADSLHYHDHKMVGNNFFSGNFQNFQNVRRSTQHGLDTPVTGQLADTPTRGLPARGLDISRTGQLAVSQMPPKERKQSTECRRWHLRVVQSATCPVRELAYPRDVQ